MHLFGSWIWQPYVDRVRGNDLMLDSTGYSSVLRQGAAVYV